MIPEGGLLTPMIPPGSAPDYTAIQISPGLHTVYVLCSNFYLRIMLLSIAQKFTHYAL